MYINRLVKTKDRVITRELRFKEDEIVDNDKLQDTENALAGLGFIGSTSMEVLSSSLKGPDHRDVLISV